MSKGQTEPEKVYLPTTEASYDLQQMLGGGNFDVEFLQRRMTWFDLCEFVRAVKHRKVKRFIARKSGHVKTPGQGES